MFGSEILDVAIGLVLVYLLGSLVCSAIKEGIAKITNLRARTLETEIRELLQSGTLVEKIYSNPLLKVVRQGLFWKSETVPTNGKPLSSPKQGKKTEYIPNADFAQALVDTIMELKSVKDGADQAFTELRAEVEKIPFAPVRNALADLMTDIKSSAADLEEKAHKTRVKVEGWFDGAMSKLSYWYKQKTKLIIFVVGLALCGIFNLDTIMIARNLYSNQALRDAVVQTASNNAAGDISKLNIQKLREDLEVAGFPLGWEVEKNSPREGFMWWVYKFFGIIATSLALSLGAPFWYEALTKLLDFRKTIKGAKNGDGKNP